MKIPEPIRANNAQNNVESVKEPTELDTQNI